MVDMIPRVTVRDPEDAILIMKALRTHQYMRWEELRQEAKRPGADQIAYSLQHIEETQYTLDLMSAVSNGIFPATPTEKD